MKIRKGISALPVAILVAALVAGCAGEEDLSDINDAWTSANDELARRVGEIRDSHEILSQRFEVIQNTDLDDPELITIRNEVEQTLADHRNTLDEVRQMLEEQSELRNEVLEGGRRGAFESAWSEAQTEYAAARAKLEELTSQHDALEEDLKHLEDALTEPETEAEPR